MDCRSCLTFKPVKIHDKHVPSRAFFRWPTKYINLFWEKLIWNQQRLILSVKENGCCWNKCDEDHHLEKAGGTIHQPTRIGQQSWNCKTSLRLSHQHTTFMSVMVRRTMLGDRSRWRGGGKKNKPMFSLWRTHKGKMWEALFLQL